MNFYAYVQNNPVRFVDPTGQDLRELLDDLRRAGLINVYQAWDLAQQSLDAAGEWAVQHNLPLDSLHNGAADAFRHCLWSCLMTQKMGADAALSISDSHERAGERGGQPANEEQMDRANNFVGRSCGQGIGADCTQACTSRWMSGELYGLGGRRNNFSQ